MFGFSNKEYRQFKKNFLKTVIFQVSFDENVNCNNLKTEIIPLFNSYFPRVSNRRTKGLQISFKNDKEQTPILQSLTDSDGIEMKSEDGQKVVFINNTSFSLTVSGRAYKNFRELKKEIESIKEFFNLCEITSVKKIAIRKMNVIDFRLTNNPTEILEHIISPDLLSNLNCFPNSEFIKQNIQTVTYLKEAFRLNLRYGLNVPPPPNTKLGQIIIDIDLINLADVPINDISDIALNMNKEIFNVFIWSISDNTIKLLNE